MAMSHDIYAIGKTADNKQFGAQRTDLFHKIPDTVISILRGMACADDIHNPFHIEVSITAIEEDKRSIGTFEKTFGI